MTSPSLALRRAIFARLSVESPVTAAGAPVPVVDEPPHGALRPPYLQLGEGTAVDASTSLYPGHEHRLVLFAVSDRPGGVEAFEIADAAVASLEAMAGPLEGHRLVNLAAVATEMRRERDGRLVRLAIRLRAVTEAT